MPTFTNEPNSRDMVVDDTNRTDYALLCVACEWEGTAKVPNAPWPVFRQHKCKLRIATPSRFN